MKTPLTILLSLTFLFLLSGSVYGEECFSKKNVSNHPDDVMCSEHIAMMRLFVENLDNGLVDDVVEQVSYPLDFWDGQRVLIIESPEQLKKHYRFIFPTEIISKISASFSKETKYFWNYKGMMFGRGDVWFNKEDGKVTTVNLVDESLIKQMGKEMSQ